MNRIRLGVAVFAGMLSMPAVYAAATFDFTNPTSSSGSSYGNSDTYTTTDSSTGATITVKATAWANTSGTDSSNNGANQSLQSAYLGIYSGGLGVTNQDGNSSGSDQDGSEGVVPEHATDNNQRYDMILLTFSQAVSLSQIKLGWVSTDSDVSVWAYAGSGSVTSLSGTYSSLFTSSSSQVTSGWTVVGNYGNACVGYPSGTGTCGAQSVDTSGFTSTSWLIGAYNPLGTATSGLDVGNDYVKLLTTTVNTASSSSSSAVPEPGSLALAGLALTGLALARRRTKQ